MSKEKTLVIRGEIYWCKLVGAARPYTGNPRYDKGPYWAVDITPDGASRMKLEDAGLTTGGKSGMGKMREPKGEKETRKETYLTLSINENKADGSKNKPPVIKDAEGNDWDGREIGNGSVADVMIKVVDYGDGVKGVYYQKMRVLDLVEYEGKDFEPLSEDDEFFAKGREKAKASQPETDTDNDGDGDDDIPF